MSVGALEFRKGKVVEPFAYVGDLLTVLPEMATDLAALPPDRRLKTDPRARRVWSR